MAEVAEPWFLCGAAATPTGGRISVTLKASIFSDCEVVWELRLVLDALGVKVQEAVKYARRHKLSAVQAVCESMGYPYENALIYSRKAALAAGVDFNDPEASKYIQQEWSLKTADLVMFLVLLVKCSAGRKKALAQAVWRFFCSNCLPPTCAGLRCFADARMADGVECSEGPAAPVCSHISRIQDILSMSTPDEHNTPQDMCASVLEEVVAGDLACPHVGRWFQGFVSDLLTPIRMHLPVAGQNNALKASPCYGPRKKRRMDEDMKKAIVERVRQDGLAPNAPTWARATGQANPKSMDRVRDEHLAAYHFASRECFEECCTIKLALDGARLGEPKEEYFIAVAENCETNQAAWCPPTVRFAGVTSGGPGDVRVTQHVCP